MKRHDLKIRSGFFRAIVSGEKTFEIRKNDRNFKVGDMLLLREYEQETEDYTGQGLLKKITYITDFEQKEGYVVMSIR